MSVFYSDIEVDHDAVVVAGPDPADGLVECELGRVDVAVGVRVGVPGSDEDVVDPSSMAGLADDGVHLGTGVRVVDVPGKARSLAGNGPRVVVVDASPADRPLARQVTDARRIRRRVEVAGDDRRKGPAVAGIKICQRDRLALTGGFRFEAPGRRS